MLTIISSTSDPERYWRVKGKTGPDHPYPGTVLQNTFMFREKALEFYKELSKNLPNTQLFQILHGEEIDVTPGKSKIPQFEEKEQEIPDVLFN